MLLGASSIPSELIGRVPALDSVLAEARCEWEATMGSGQDPDPDCLLRAVVVPHICAIARRGLKEAEMLLVRQLFDFVEELLADPRPSVQSIGGVSFAEQHGADSGAVAALRSFTGPLLRREVERH